MNLYTDHPSQKQSPPPKKKTERSLSIRNWEALVPGIYHHKHLNERTECLPVVHWWHHTLRKSALEPNKSREKSKVRSQDQQASSPSLLSFSSSSFATSFQIFQHTGTAAKKSQLKTIPCQQKSKQTTPPKTAKPANLLPTDCPQSAQWPGGFSAAVAEQRSLLLPAQRTPCRRWMKH